jgi:hypothetical protein
MRASFRKDWRFLSSMTVVETGAVNVSCFVHWQCGCAVHLAAVFFEGVASLWGAWPAASGAIPNLRVLIFNRNCSPAVLRRWLKPLAGTERALERTKTWLLRRGYLLFRLQVGL